MDRVTLGFKLLSSIFEEGMSSKLVARLEKNRKINWARDIDDIVERLNGLFKILLSIEYFKYLQSWKKSIMELTTNAIALEFVVLLLNKWTEIGAPTIDSGELKAFKRNAVILFDRLVYENATKVWRGSGDSKMANDIKNPNTRLIPVAKSDWALFIKNACNGTVAGGPATVESLRPILYHYYCLTKCSPTTNIDTTYDVDHIIPKERFVGNSSIDENLQNSLINLALLPTKDNISKKSKALEEIHETWLKQEISKYTGIDESDFPKYSDVSFMSDLQEYRKSIFLEAFTTNRNTILSN